MKASHLGICLAIWIALAAFAIPGDAAAKAGQGSGLVFSSFELKGTHNYAVEVIEFQEGDFPPEVVVAVRRSRSRASYEVPGGLEPGMHAAFGSLGRVAVGFHRERRSVDRPEKGCRWIFETGVFRGEFSFTGEGGYTAAEMTSAPGEILRLPNGFCGFGDDRRGFPPPDFLQVTSLTARSRIPHGFAEFDASKLGIDSRFDIAATTRESVGPMKISRSVSTNGSKGSVALGRGKPPHSAVVNPPPPFEGSARFRDPPNGPPTWTGSLSVSLPGMPSVALAGPDFAARICPHLSLLAKCKVDLPPRTGGRSQLQISGSQSQAFWDTRLSWSR